MEKGINTSEFWIGMLYVAILGLLTGLGIDVGPFAKFATPVVTVFIGGRSIRKMLKH